MSWLVRVERFVWDMVTTWFGKVCCGRWDGGGWEFATVGIG